MNITYSDTKEFSPQQLQDLFLSLDWSSGHYPDKLTKAMKNSDTVYTAWDEDKLVGLINVLDDGIMTAYIHFLLVMPAYQSKGIGNKLIRLIKEKYNDYLRIIVISYSDKTNFYESCGFDIGYNETAMFITSLLN